MRVSQEIHGDERLVLLAMALDNRVGLTFDELRERGLLGNPDGQEGTLRKALIRACRQFDEMGIKVVEDDRSGEKRWRIETRLTYAQPSEVSLSANDALDLLAAVTAYLQGSKRPYDADVRRAREKLASVMGLTSSPVMAQLKAAKKDPAGEDYRVLLLCRANRTPCRFLYRDARGTEASHTVRPYGFFERSGRSYLVAFDDAHVGEEPVRVFRIDRITAGSAGALKGSYDIPTEFDVADYIRLPFEYGDGTDPFEARFFLAGEKVPDLDALTGGRGTWAPCEGGWTWSIEACNLEACSKWAAWAASRGLVAQDPPELVEACASNLERTAAAHV